MCPWAKYYIHLDRFQIIIKQHTIKTRKTYKKKTQRAWYQLDKWKLNYAMWVISICNHMLGFWRRHYAWLKRNRYVPICIQNTSVNFVQTLQKNLPTMFKNKFRTIIKMGKYIAISVGLKCLICNVRVEYNFVIL